MKSTRASLPAAAIATATLILLTPSGSAIASQAATIHETFRLFGTITVNPIPGVPTPIDTLVMIDPHSGDQTLIGAVGSAIGVHQMDADPATGLLFGTDYFSKPGVIYKIDPATGVASIAAILPVRVDGVAFAPDGTLFGVDATNQIAGHVLGTIDLKQQTFRPIMTLQSGVAVRSIDFSPAGLLHAISIEAPSQQQSLIVIDVRNRAVLSRTPLSSLAVADLDYASDGFIYHSNSSFALFRMDPVSGVQSIVGFGDLGGGGGLASIETQERPIHVEIDVKPGTSRNSINPCSGGVVPVAILSSSSFDAATVDRATVTLGGAGVRVKRQNRQAGSLRDIDGDGDLDLVVHVRTVHIGLQYGDAAVMLTGTTVDGAQIEGTDTVHLVGLRRATRGHPRGSCQK